MKKDLLILMLAGILAGCFLGCGNSSDTGKREVGNVETEVSEEKKFSKEMEPSEEAVKPEEQEEFSFSHIKNLEFEFSSGAGGWRTMLVIRGDGSFSGEYFDSDMGTIGDGYPAGTAYLCDFSGKFTKPVKVNEYTYSMEIAEIEYEQETGTEEIRDEMLYRYTDPYGLSGAKNILIYLPGAPLSELPEEFRSWIGHYDLADTEDAALTFYALNNENEQQGFISFPILDNLNQMLASTKERASELENSINKEPLDQSQLNETSMQLYEIWDYALNSIWNTLKRTMDEDAMANLIKEEREWIEKKEQEVIKAGAEFEGGSMEPMLRNLKGAELTKARAYELMEIIEKN